MRWLLQDLGVASPNPTPLHYDNTDTIQITLNPVKHSLSKHIRMDVFFLRDQYGQGTLAPQIFSSERQHADLFTKSQTQVQHEFLLSKLSVYDLP